MSKTMSSFGSIIIICMLVMSCSSNLQAPQISYYLFDANPIKPTSNIASEQHKRKRIMISSIDLPDYLSTNQLVMREDGHSLIKANYHSWADSLDDAMQRALIDDLNRISNDVEFVKWCENCTSIKVTVEHFYPSTSGNLLFSGYFEQMVYTDESNSTDPATLSRFHFLDKLQSSGYANSVVQMRAQVNDLAQMVITQTPKQ